MERFRFVKMFIVTVVFAVAATAFFFLVKLDGIKFDPEVIRNIL